MGQFEVCKAIDSSNSNTEIRMALNKFEMKGVIASNFKWYKCHLIWFMSGSCYYYKQSDHLVNTWDRNVYMSSTAKDNVLYL